MIDPIKIYSIIKDNLFDKNLCKIIKQEENTGNAGDKQRLAEKLLKLLKSLKARADFAPIIYSNWGYDGLIAYYLSHAAKAVFDVEKPIDEHIKENLGKQQQGRSPEKTGYLLYMKILDETLSNIYGKSSQATTFKKLTDNLINLGTEQEDLLEILEYIKRYTEILVEPIINTLEKYKKDEREKIIDQIQNMFCDENTDDPQKRVGGAGDQ